MKDVDIFINTIVMKEDEYQSQSDFLEDLAALHLPISGVEIRREYLPEDEKEKKEELKNILSIAKKNHWSLRYSVPESLFLPEGINKDLNTWKKEAEFLEILSMKVNIGEINDKMIDFSILENLSFLITIENDQTKENGNIPSIVNAGV